MEAEECGDGVIADRTSIYVLDRDELISMWMSLL